MIWPSIRKCSPRTGQATGFVRFTILPSRTYSAWCCSRIWDHSRGARITRCRPCSGGIGSRMTLKTFSSTRVAVLTSRTRSTWRGSINWDLSWRTRQTRWWSRARILACCTWMADLLTCVCSMCSWKKKHTSILMQTFTIKYKLSYEWGTNFSLSEKNELRKVVNPWYDFYRKDPCHS